MRVEKNQMKEKRQNIWETFEYEISILKCVFWTFTRNSSQQFYKQYL